MLEKIAEKILNDLQQHSIVWWCCIFLVMNKNDCVFVIIIRSYYGKTHEYRNVTT